MCRRLPATVGEQEHRFGVQYRPAATRVGGMVRRLLTFLDELVRDAGQALRALRQNPAFGAAAILTLAIGIGANSAMFSVIHHVLLQPLAYPDSDSLVFVSRGASRPGNKWLSLPRVE